MPGLYDQAVVSPPEGAPERCSNCLWLCVKDLIVSDLRGEKGLLMSLGSRDGAGEAEASGPFSCTGPSKAGHSLWGCRASVLTYAPVVSAPPHNRRAPQPLGDVTERAGLPLKPTEKNLKATPLRSRLYRHAAPRDLSGRCS